MVNFEHVGAWFEMGDYCSIYVLGFSRFHIAFPKFIHTKVTT
jgi:hypothetical protein